MRGDSGFDGQLWRYHGRNAENGGHIPSLIVAATDAPSEALLGLGVPGHVEHLNVTLPRYFTPENLFNGHRGDMLHAIAAVSGRDALA